MNNAREHLWQVGGLRLRGLAWGDPSLPPVLALHGWLDNAASFAALAAMLTDFHFVAPDLAGHGRSDWRSRDAGYQIWDDLEELLEIARQNGWERFSVMGHSRGAMVAALLAGTFPDRVQSLVLLDSLLPVPTPEASFCDQLRRHLEDRKKAGSAVGRRFATWSGACEFRRQRAELSAEAVAALAERGLVAMDGGYTWLCDPRVRGASAVKLSAVQIDTVMRNITMPALLWLSEWGESHLGQDLEQARRLIPQLTVHKDGIRHHGHMDEALQSLAEQIPRCLTVDSDGSGTL